MLACGATVLVPSAAPAAEPEKPADKARCADAYKNAQVQRKNGALKRARESLLVCVSDRCPSVMQPDCTRWLTEVEAALPSVSLAAKGADGSDVTAVRVSIDGQLVTDTLDGKAIPLDPGSHALRFEYGDEPAIEQTIIMREGEKARVVTASFAKARAADDSALPADSAPRPSRGAPTSAWIAGAVGLAGLATFGVLGAHGMSRRSELEKDCFGRCSQDQVDSIKTELTAADVALGVGVASLGVSAILFLTSGGSSSEPVTGKTRAPSVSFGIAPLREGGAASVGGRF